MKKSILLVVFFLVAQALFANENGSGNSSNSDLDYYSIVLGSNMDFNRMSAYFKACNSVFGVYCGFVTQTEIYADKNPLAKVSSNSSFDDISTYSMNKIIPEGGDYYDYNWKFKRGDNSHVYDSFGFYGGFTFKLIPHTWLLVGVGMEMTDRDFYYGEYWYQKKGDYYNHYTPGDWKLYEKGWIEVDEDNLYFAPQAGLNFIAGFFDISAMVSYPITGNFQFDLLIGVAFGV